jgi:hypothetical protein
MRRSRATFMATTLALESTAAATGKGKIKSFSRF